MKVQIVIPARLASTRLPEKLLRKVGGKTVLNHTHDAAQRSRFGADIVVAVDDRRLADEVDRFGGRWIMTAVDCPSGTDRIAQVAAQMPSAEVFVNVQGDEPEIAPEVIDRVGQMMIDDPRADMATMGTPIRSVDALHDPGCVKIVWADSAQSPRSAGRQGRAVYFSRSPVPFDRSGITDQKLASEPPLAWHHLGLYAYRREFLAWFAATPPSRLEQLERLEQLRAIEAGKRICVARTDSAVAGIDTENDLAAFARRWADNEPLRLDET